MAEEEPTCRVCWGGPGPLGLADALLQPCACRSYIHLGCLFDWQIEKVRMLRDPSRCEVCNQMYFMPAPAVQALNAVGGINTWNRRMVQCWAVMRPVLTTAWNAVMCLGAVLVKCCCLGQALAHSAVLCIRPGDVPQHWAGGATPPSQLAQLARLTKVSAVVLAAWVALEYAIVRDWQTVRQQGNSWRAAKKVASGSALAAAALLLQRWCHVDWHVAGAPAKQPLTAKAADVVATLTLVLMTLRITTATASWATALGRFAPKSLSSLAVDGMRLLKLGSAAETADLEQLKTARTMLQLFQQRPATLRALHAVLRGNRPVWWVTARWPTAMRSWF